MITVVSYDVTDNRRRQSLAKLLERYGERVQKSVFEMVLEEKELAGLVRKIERLIKKEEDSVRIYRLPADAVRLSLWIGVRVEVTDRDYYLF
jgi:CRISPR-associated protein Cas2